MAGPRIGVASLVQETNTFSPKSTVRDDYTVLVGEDACRALAGRNTESPQGWRTWTSGRVEAPLYLHDRLVM